jgi:AcrR family transcriptional regulator
MSTQPSRKKSNNGPGAVDTERAARSAAPPSKEDIHARKRIEVLEATWRSIRRVGLEQVTIREIASELKATTGTVVHYFRTKDEILVYALDHLISGMVAEIESSLQGVAGLARLEQMLYASLPLDEEGELGWRIWLAFLKTSIGSTELSAEHARRYAYMRKSLVDEIAALQKQKLVRTRIDIALEADALIALIDGIGVGRVIDPTRFEPRHQRQLITRHIQAFLAVQAG